MMENDDMLMRNRQQGMSDKGQLRDASKKNNMYDVPDKGRPDDTAEERYLPTLPEYKKKYALSSSAQDALQDNRKAIKDILDRKDPRRMIILGPCSIWGKHDVALAKEIALLAQEVSDTFLLVFRAYTQKPRTTIGWKGLDIHPDLTRPDHADIEAGLEKTGRLLHDMAELRIPIAAELLYPMLSEYHENFISYGAIGARNSQSQIHREMASYLSDIPIGVKNSTSGDITGAMNSMIAATSQGEPFFSQDRDGRLSVKLSKGNPYTHLILRGGNKMPNYQPGHVAEAISMLGKKRLRQNIIVDCSHDNSVGTSDGFTGKDFKNQIPVALEVIRQMVTNPHIAGLMLEASLLEAKQDIKDRHLRPGVSITDPCLDYDMARQLIRKAREMLQQS